MRYRAGELGDVPTIVQLYGQYLDANPGVYPDYSNRPEALREFARPLVVNMVTNPAWICVVAVVGAELVPVGDNGTERMEVRGGTVVGFGTGVVGPRALGEPKSVFFCEYLVVDTRFRTKGVAKALVLLGGQEGRRRGAVVFEAAWKAGSDIGKFWEEVGMKPYLIYGAFIDAEGKPRTDLVTLQHAPDGEKAAAKPVGSDTGPVV